MYGSAIISLRSRATSFKQSKTARNLKLRTKCLHSYITCGSAALGNLPRESTESSIHFYTNRDYNMRLLVTSRIKCYIITTTVVDAPSYVRTLSRLWHELTLYKFWAHISPNLHDEALTNTAARLSESAAARTPISGSEFEFGTPARNACGMRNSYFARSVKVTHRHNSPHRFLPKRLGVGAWYAYTKSNIAKQGCALLSGRKCGWWNRRRCVAQVLRLILQVIVPDMLNWIRETET